jgi:serine protease
MKILAALLAACVAVLGTSLPALANPSDAAGAPTARVIVGYRDGAALANVHPWRKGAPAKDVRAASQRRADALARRAGFALTTGRVIGHRAQVVMAQGVDSASLARRLAADPDVAWAVVDQRRRALTVPSDPLFSAGPAVNLQTLTGGPVVGQWYLREPTDLFRSATNAQAAWAKSTGNGVVVAVLDTGVLADHVDLAGQLLSGYDFVLETIFSNDGDGRDAEASDPGDWCGLEPSSWHGTGVAGIVAATANNGIGMAGLAHGAKVLPVRVLGKCGGRDSDIIAGMRWAAGVEVPGMSPNPNPTRVLNLSLGGGPEECTTAYQDAIAAVTARGAVVVAAAGNSDGGPVGAPANCPGVIAVAGLRHAGTKVGFSDLGPEIAIAAPGGNCVNIETGQPCLYPILTLSNSGLTVPAAGGSIYSDSFNISVGTSFAAPMVAATAALILSARPDLSPAQVKQALQSGARPFPTSGADNGSDATPVTTCQPPSLLKQLQCYCVTGLCGAGMLDVSAALAAAEALPVTPSAPDSGGGGGALSWPWLLALLMATAALSARPRRRPAGRG